MGPRAGWSIEAPPPEYASGPTQTGKTYEIKGLTPEQTNYLCRTHGVWLHEPSGFPVACYIPTMDAVIVPDPKFWPSKNELEAMRVHEWAHARGNRHNDDGTGSGPASLPPMAWTHPGFQPNDPDNPSPLYRGPPAPPPNALLAQGPAPMSPNALK